MWPGPLRFPDRDEARHNPRRRTVRRYMSQRALIGETAITIAIWAVLVIVFPKLPLLAVIALGIPLGYLVARGGPALVRAIQTRRQASAVERTDSVG